MTAYAERFIDVPFLRRTDALIFLSAVRRSPLSASLTRANDRLYSKRVFTNQPPGLQAVTDRRGGAAIFTQPNADDVAHLRRQLGEVDRLLAARYPGAALHASSADVALLQRLLDECRRKPDQTLELQCLGVAFGSVLAREAGLHWIMVLDEYGRDPALQYESTSLIVFPLTMISQRVDAGEPVDLRRLLRAVRALVQQHARESDPASGSI